MNQTALVTDLVGAGQNRIRVGENLEANGAVGFYAGAFADQRLAGRRRRRRSFPEKLGLLGHDLSEPRNVLPEFLVVVQGFEQLIREALHSYSRHGALLNVLDSLLREHVTHGSGIVYLRSIKCKTLENEKCGSVKKN